MTEQAIDVAFSKFTKDRDGQAGAAEREAFGAAVRMCARGQDAGHQIRIEQAGEIITQCQRDLDEQRSLVTFMRNEVARALAARDAMSELHGQMTSEITRLKLDVVAYEENRARMGQLSEEVDKRWMASKAEVVRLEERQQVHLAQIARLSQTVPLESEVAGALDQRGALLAEIGTLRAKIEQMTRGNAAWNVPGMVEAVDLAMVETFTARAKHGSSLEATRCSDDKRLRILVEEVGEVAQAIELVEVAEFDENAGYANGESGEWSPADARNHMTEEIVQVASAALRWVALRVASGG